MSAEANEDEHALLRHRMVKEQLRHRGITDERVLDAMAKVPRHRFVPSVQAPYAYDDGPLPIGSGQTISQPYMVARMSELLALDKTSRVLEIGTGSGYQTAILAELAGHVWTVERLPELAGRAEDLLIEQGYANISLVVGDGSLGYPEEAPYDAVLVTAAAPAVPPSLRAQMDIHGRMVIPRQASAASQELLLIERLKTDKTDSHHDDPADKAAYRETSVLNCVFVPLIGEEGYKS